MTLTVGSLFSGIGGLDLGLERAGMRVRWQCEIDPYCRRVLAKHWPGVPCHDDVTTLTDPEPVDVICAGFPCQDLSAAGKQAGIHAARSGLYFGAMRVVRLARPRYVLLENVPGLLARPEWMGAVLRELAASGFDAEWDCIPAAAVGAPHIRDRVFIVGIRADGPDAEHDGRLAEGEGQRSQTLGEAPRREGREGHQPATAADCVGRDVPDADHGRQPQSDRERGQGLDGQQRDDAVRLRDDVADADGTRFEGPSAGRLCPEESEPSGRGWWQAEPNVGRVADGIPARVDRLRGLGNAVVPQVAEYVGRLIMQHANATSNHNPNLEIDS